MKTIKQFKKAIDTLVGLSEKQDKIIKQFEDLYGEHGYTLSYVLGDGWNILDIESSILYPCTEANFSIIMKGGHIRDDRNAVGY